MVVAAAAAHLACDTSVCLNPPQITEAGTATTKMWVSLLPEYIRPVSSAIVHTRDRSIVEPGVSRLETRANLDEQPFHTSNALR